MQSYYGSLPVAKRFEFTQREGELQLPEGIVGTGNSKILRRRSGQHQEDTFRRSAQINLANGLEIARARRQQGWQAQGGFEAIPNAPKCLLLSFAKIEKRKQRDVAFAMAQDEKGTECLRHVESGNSLACFTFGK
jgi:hypothetical protein